MLKYEQLGIMMDKKLKEEICSCAEFAVGHDIQKSGYTYKSLAIEYFPEKSPDLAHQLLIDTLNPNKNSPKLGAEQAIVLCRKTGRGTGFLFYVFERLHELLSDEDAQAFVNHACEKLHYETPKLMSGYVSKLLEIKAALTNEIQSDIDRLNEKSKELERVNIQLRPIHVVPKESIR